MSFEAEEEDCEQELYTEKVFSASHDVLIIAEAGSAHGGDLGRARRLIEAAAEAGADAVKFQLIFADEIVHPKVGPIELPGGPRDIYTSFKELERSPDFYHELKRMSEEAGLRFLCSPFGSRSLRILLDMDVEWIKIASPELNHYPLLQEARVKPLLISTGISSLADIEESLAFLRLTGAPKPPVALLHCITAYPAPAREYNLRLIARMAAIFGLPTGVSDHSKDPVLVPSLASALRARFLEKHICLSAGDGGLDDPIALPPADFAQMVEAVRSCEGRELREVAERLELSGYSREEIEEVLGNGIKRLAPSEAPWYAGSNRSLVARTDMGPGERIGEKNTALLRAEQGHRAGLAPRFLSTVTGRRIAKPVAAGEGITWDHLLQ